MREYFRLRSSQNGLVITTTMVRQCMTWAINEEDSTALQEEVASTMASADVADSEDEADSVGVDSAVASIMAASEAAEVSEVVHHSEDVAELTNLKFTNHLPCSEIFLYKVFILCYWRDYDTICTK